jgi:short-subunit dehydrogenase
MVAHREGQSAVVSTALVTGPTAGIGREVAKQLSSRGHRLILVARDAQRLAALADELGNAETLPADLSDPAQRATVEEAARDVDWLVNNAGYGLNSTFMQSTIEEEQQLLDVLVTAPMRLTHAALPGMVQRGRGRILNVSSVAGWIPFGTYSAAKSWLTVFSEGLAAETPNSVHVTALCPGFTRTEFHQRAEMQVGYPDWVWLNAADVARQGINDCERGKVISVPDLRYQALTQVARHAPRALLRRAAQGRSE